MRQFRVDATLTDFIQKSLDVGRGNGKNVFTGLVKNFNTDPGILIFLKIIVIHVNTKGVIKPAGATYTRIILTTDLYSI